MISPPKTGSQTSDCTFKNGWYRRPQPTNPIKKKKKECKKSPYQQLSSGKFCIAKQFKQIVMEALYSLPFFLFEVPNLKLKRPSWLHQPSAMTVFSFVLLSYFLVTGGIIYDVIVEPPSVGSTTDEHGHSRPVAFMPYRVNGQYIMEGLASSFLFTIGGLGFIIMDQTHTPGKPKLNKILLIAMGFIFIVVSFITTWIFMRMKLPGYLQP